MLNWKDKPCKFTGNTINKDGYCREGYEGKTELSHRVAWIKHFGYIPKDQFICHHCDVRHCIEIAHLFLGDALVNNQDCANKGRSSKSGNSMKGSANGLSKLIEEDIPKIRFELGLGISRTKIAKRYNVSVRNITAIALGETWSHIK